ncbi:MAG TPA: polyhydroxyalkanoate synthesis regulator DNA-binding domain-containing protein [Pseudomonadota bacterium]|jgi:polyhydroxyalkanoate synthesis repressor PhaR|nr:polyhydroxyalkanoate synthesis regulator DNA-binding domain-containing protein [Pseudomonadota bacterium]HNK46697.1 polyhydroxyalkanoate synthesis regulator DNA-binding domain-containing protein [Pseudomonadota bacterium]HNO67896.1 polyhydroxyalkanoate synthesis regulator DNA-binding domain-containing protein [Pseudomonadota bacterium]
MAEPRIIKRYSNRKLYDTQSSQYVTLEQIALMIRQGEEVQVLDNSSKEDLTSVTLAQIIFEEEKRQKNFISLGAMRQLIQSGGASLSELAQQAQARVRSVFRKGDVDGKTLEADESSDPLRRQMLSDNPSAVRELLERWQIALEDWQRKVDDRVHGVVESLSPFAALEKEVTRLQKRVDELEARLTPPSPPDAQ